MSVNRSVRLILGVAVLAFFAVVAIMSWPQGSRAQGITLEPGQAVSGTITISADGTSQSELRVLEQATYYYDPKPDITTHELALLLPRFSGPAYGMGQWSTGGQIIPAKDEGAKGGGCVVGRPLFEFHEYDIEELGAAIRHFEKCER